jgi:hypothetical protein
VVDISLDFANMPQSDLSRVAASDIYTASLPFLSNSTNPVRFSIGKFTTFVNFGCRSSPSCGSSFYSARDCLVELCSHDKLFFSSPCSKLDYRGNAVIDVICLMLYLAGYE